MLKNRLWLLLSLSVVMLLTPGCRNTTGVKMALENNNVHFDQPPLSITFKQEVIAHEDDQHLKKIIFAEPGASPLFIEFIPKPRVSTLTYYHDLKYIAENNYFYYVAPVFFDSQEWARVFRVDTDGYLLYGYLTLRDGFFIYTYMVEGLNKRGIERFLRFQQTRRMDNSGHSFIAKRFQKFHSYVGIAR